MVLVHTSALFTAAGGDSLCPSPSDEKDGERFLKLPKVTAISGKGETCTQAPVSTPFQ